MNSLSFTSALDYALSLLSHYDEEDVALMWFSRRGTNLQEEYECIVNTSYSKLEESFALPYAEEVVSRLIARYYGLKSAINLIAWNEVYGAFSSLRLPLSLDFNHPMFINELFGESVIGPEFPRQLMHFVIRAVDDDKLVKIRFSPNQTLSVQAAIDVNSPNNARQLVHAYFNEPEVVAEMLGSYFMGERAYEFAACILYNRPRLALRLLRHTKLDSRTKAKLLAVISELEAMNGSWCLIRSYLK